MAEQCDRIDVLFYLPYAQLIADIVKKKENNLFQFISKISYSN